MSTILPKQHNTLVRAQALKPSLLDIRHQIHAHPELGFEEIETSKLVAGLLSKLGFDVRIGIGGTGVLAELGEGRTVILRADMDALPITEVTDKPYGSQNKGVMHACGHDVHVTCALGAAMLLAETPPKKGCVRFLFQPAEETVNAEGKSGACLMIEQGAAVDAEAVFALHVDPRLPVGQIAVREGPLLAACDTFKIVVHGVGSHGAYPELGVDAIVLASQVVQSLQTVISRRKSALEPAILTVGGIASDTFRPNILPQQVELTGTIRYFEPTLHNLLHEEIEKACTIADALGGSHTLEFNSDNPTLVNDPQLTNLVRFVGKSLLGATAVIEAKQETGADDFSFLSAHMPGCYFLLGALIPDNPRKLHTPTFDIDESAIPIGATMLAEVARCYLGELF
ncbi:MAG: amidohydrolase [Candidatus Melainabacteria bacterium]|nr:amidohydrolase [Candidatus Melainabacteria bacterium]